MSQENIYQLYPNATLDGQPIPFDVLLSSGIIIQPFTNVAVDNVAIPTETELLILYSDQNCFLSLSAAIVLPANGAFGAGIHYIPANCMKIIDPDGATAFSVIRQTANGTLVVECAYKWMDAKKVTQFNNQG